MDFLTEKDSLFLFESFDAFIVGMATYGLSRTDAIKEWVRMDGGEPGVARRYFLKHGYLP